MSDKWVPEATSGAARANCRRPDILNAFKTPKLGDKFEQLLHVEAEDKLPDKRRVMYTNKLPPSVSCPYHDILHFAKGYEDVSGFLRILRPDSVAQDYWTQSDNSQLLILYAEMNTEPVW